MKRVVLNIKSEDVRRIAQNLKVHPTESQVHRIVQDFAAGKASDEHWGQAIEMAFDEMGIRAPVIKKECPAGLIALRNSLKREIKDEREASSRYSEAAGKLDHYKQGVKPDILRMMSTEEMMHAHMLNYIVDHITKECGE